MRQRKIFLAAAALAGLQLQTAAADDRYGPVAYPGVYVTTPIAAAQVVEQPMMVASAPSITASLSQDVRLQALGASVRLNQIHRAVPATNDSAAVRSPVRAKVAADATPRYAVRPSLEAVAVLEAAKPISVPTKIERTFDSQVVPAAYVVPVIEQRPSNGSAPDDANPLRSLGGFSGAATRAANPLR
ncbi:MAG: hypothetical protein JNK76_12585 [Planctomycetales bacterium]|nr:hypothetical protein [Planctomycetales bacterium]MBN8627769.1 hypothetical protein [Planctomycetota bacterium]